MNPVMSLCPVCEETLSITRLHCSACETSIEGRFSLGPFARLSAEQLHFVEAFVRCEGKLTHLEGELGMSYPTLRGRLNEIVQAMVYTPRAQAKASRVELAEARRAVLDALDAGEIDAADALRQLGEIGGQ